MNAVIKQKIPEQDKVLKNHGLASLTFSLQWSDGRAVHDEEMHVENFSVFREADFLPVEIGGRLVGMTPGDYARAELPVGEITGDWDATREVSGSPCRFDREYLPGLKMEPHCGRFYPRGIFHGLEGIVREAIEPARITALDEHAMHVDLNHPLARYSFRLTCHVVQVLPGSDMRGGRCSSPLDDLLRYPGLAAPLQDGLDTRYVDEGSRLARMDEQEDKLFYTTPRLVQHLDARALQTVDALYARILPAGADVLDLMASHDSHLQGCSQRSLHVLGMNAEELEANSSATSRLVLDLNQDSTLPYEDSCLDAVICTASVEYLVQPQRIFEEVLRVLRPGGVFALTFSNRWFPGKAITVWSELHEFERVGMVTQWLQQAGFEDLHTFSSRGWPRPVSDAHYGQTTVSDPVYAVWGFRAS